MKKTTKKGPSKASHRKAVKDLQVRPARGGSVRGGTAVPSKPSKSSPTVSITEII